MAQGSSTDTGSVSRGFDLSGVRLVFDGLHAELAERLHREWEPYATEPVVRPFLRFTVSNIKHSYTEQEYRPKQMEAQLAVDAAHFRLPEGEAEVDSSGLAKIALLGGIGDREFFSLLNFVRACLAWRLPSRSGGLIHAAGIVIEGRGFLLVGAEGSGKSTWANLASTAGCTVLSDDLIMIDGVGEEMMLLGAPFRSTFKSDLVQGRWPLCALLFPVHGEVPVAAPTPRLLARARLTANLPFIAEGLELDQRVAALIERLSATVACADLTFALDTSFVELLRNWPKE